MNDIDRQILSFMRDVEIPEQGAFYVTLINNNIERDIRQAHLRRLEARNLIETVDPEVPSYGLTAKGLQVIVSEDLNQALSNTQDSLNEQNKSLEVTNRRLESTVNALNKQQESQRRSSAVQTIFSVTIILFTTFQVANSSVIQNTGSLDGKYIVLFGLFFAVLAIVFGIKPILTILYSTATSVKNSVA